MEPLAFSARLTRQPLPFSPEQGREALAHLPDLGPEMSGLIRGAAGSSPYLAGLIAREGGWLAEALSQAPEAAIAAALELGGEEGADEASLRSALRRAKRRVALLTGLADLGGVFALEEVTGALTRLADMATDRALRFQVGREIARAKLPGQGEDDIASAGGAVALAMGKMGAFELNYSSDIDLIVLFDESRYARDDFHEARAALIRATRRMVAMLAENTHEGYVFRTDLRLRPDPSVTPVCVSMEAAERYYESLGRSWERAAYIKARPAAGDLAAGAGFLERLRPFIWRKHLDFAAIQDAHDIRLRIRAHKGLGGAISLDGHDLKLGRGGIREIEFFTQTRQLIAGGRDPELRQRATVAALAALADKGWVPQDVADTLSRHYRHLRRIEHLVQMVNDAQTHKLPGDGEGWRRLAMMTGEGDAGALRAGLHQALDEVHALTEGFFAPDACPLPAPEIDAQSEEITARWPSYPALRSQRARALFERLKPDLLARLARADRPREALVAFDGFLAGLPAGVQLFSLFAANRHLIDLIVDIAATAPELAAYLGRHSAVLDAVIGGDFFADWPGEAALSGELSARLAEAPDYESALGEARRWMREWHFRIGVHQLRALIDAQEAGRQYGELASAVLAALWPVVVAEFSRKHGPPPGEGAAVVAMGSLGAGALNARSDLDLIVLYEPGGIEASDGRRPLATRPYYARLTQAFITALSAPMGQGRLYEVDMRLRPSGRQGPVATSLTAFDEYQRQEAWTWEHLALSRARVVAGASRPGARFEEIRQQVLDLPRERAKILADVAEMRARIASAKGSGGPLEAKLGAGRLLDIELIAQTGALLGPSHPRDTLAQIEAGARAGLYDEAGAKVLRAAYRIFWSLQLGARLLTGDALDAQKLGQGGRAFLLRETGFDDIGALEAALADHASAAAAVIEAALNGENGSARHEGEADE